MHRMIDCLGSNVLQYLSSIINQLMINCGLKDMIEFVRLLNQLMSKFKVNKPHFIHVDLIIL